MAESKLIVAIAFPGTTLVILLVVMTYLVYLLRRKYRSHNLTSHDQQRSGNDHDPEEIMMTDHLDNSKRISFVNPLSPVPENQLTSQGGGSRSRREEHRLSERSIFGSSVRSYKGRLPNTFAASIESAGVWL